MSKLQKIKKRLLNAQGQIISKQDEILREVNRRFILAKQDQDLREACESITQIPDVLLGCLYNQTLHGVAWDPRVSDWVGWRYQVIEGELYRHQWAWPKIQEMLTEKTEVENENPEAIFKI